MGKEKRREPRTMSACLMRVRMSPSKVRLVADLVRGKSYDEAVTKLSFVNKRAAPILLKLIKSAAANAEEATEFASDELYVRCIYVDGAGSFVRRRPGFRGRPAIIRKQMSHVTVELAPAE
ncbi:MAG: 50S ribosomal protein L22 [bacterium]